jgi:hypothetical protein
MKKEVSKGKTKTKKVAKKEPTKSEILKKMKDPNISLKELNRLDKLLCKDIEFK